MIDKITKKDMIHPDVFDSENDPEKLRVQGVIDSITDFATVHIKPHPGNETIITYEDGEQVHYKEDGSILTKPAPAEGEETNENS